MKANELRIGNLVNTINREGEIHLPNSTIFSVQEIGFDCILCDINKIPSQERTLPVFAVRDLCPIDLTEEWLEKLGFDFDGYTYNMGKLSINHKSADRPKGRVYYNSWAVSEKRPEFVHQLQNLYFALAGEELTIKETK